MSDRRYVIAYGGGLKREVGRAPDAEPGDFLTREQAAARIVSEMDGVIEAARESRRRAVRILQAERRKRAVLAFLAAEGQS